MMMMKRELAASCLTMVRWSHKVGASAMTYGGRRVPVVAPVWVSPVHAGIDGSWAPPVPNNEPSRRLTSSCKRSCAMSRINWLRRASALPCTGKGKGENPSDPQSLTCHMESHSVTCHPTQANAPRLDPSQTGWYSIYLPRKDEKPSWPWCWLYTKMVYQSSHPSIHITSSNRLILFWPGVEPKTWSQVKHFTVAQTSHPVHFLLCLGLY